MDATGVLDRLTDLGINARVDGERLFLSPMDKVPADLLADVRQHKPEILSRIRHRTDLVDLPWPVGYGGLPVDEVASGEADNDRKGTTDPVERRLNVLNWMRCHYRDIGDTAMADEMRTAYHELRHADREIQEICGICEYTEEYLLKRDEGRRDRPAFTRRS